MSIIGWYYLHANGDLIYKRDLDGTVADIRESDFARALWPMDPEDRAGAWRILVEASALKANPERVKALAEKWGCTDEDAKHYADHIGIDLFMDGNAWAATRKDFINLQESPAGFGATCLAAMTELCAELGYRGGKMWNATFHDLVKIKEAA
jgi:hypothetical protein